jgi:hypothetical protein
MRLRCSFARCSLAIGALTLLQPSAVFAQNGAATKPADAGAASAEHEAAPAPEAAEAAPVEPTPAEAPTPAPEAAAPAPASSNATRAEAMRAYQAALAKQKLSASVPLSRQRLRDELTSIESKIDDGRRDEAIGDLVYFVESERFKAFADTEEGRAMRFLLGDSLGRAGAYEPARGYLAPLLDGDPNETSSRRAARSLVDLGLESGAPGPFIKDLEKVSPQAPKEILGEVHYLRGRDAELKGEPEAALKEYAQVTDRSRFWAQATYLSGVIEVERKQYKRGEQLFCKVADPKQTPRVAAVFGGSDFFRVRDMARLGLGRVAHEQYRFDDARYYYFLVPRDSERLPEALYETATTRYEAKDYEAAREAMDELKLLKVNHSYEDEAWLLDAYLDLAMCKFPAADKKLNEFLRRYEPVRDAARKLRADDTAVRNLADATRTGADPAGAGLGSTRKLRARWARFCASIETMRSRRAASRSSITRSAACAERWASSTTFPAGSPCPRKCGRSRTSRSPARTARNSSASKGSSPSSGA